MEPGTGEQPQVDDGGSGISAVGILPREDGPGEQTYDDTPVGPPPGWDPFEATDRLRQITHDYPEHWAQRERWAAENKAWEKEHPGLENPDPKQCDWCEEHGKTLRFDSGEERVASLLEVDDDSDYEDS